MRVCVYCLCFMFGEKERKRGETKFLLKKKHEKMSCCYSKENLS